MTSQYRNVESISKPISEHEKGPSISRDEMRCDETDLLGHTKGLICPNEVSLMIYRVEEHVEDELQTLAPS